MTWKRHLSVPISALVLAAAAAITVPVIAHSQTQGMERRYDRRDDRRNARDTRQTGRQEARDAKWECKAGDDKIRAECRQIKRNTKQQARQDARMIKMD
jgi:hypothetical protein